jgi:hypothetical protein
MGAGARAEIPEARIGHEHAAVNADRMEEEG